MMKTKHSIVLIEDSESSYRFIKAVLRNDYDLHWIRDVEERSVFSFLKQTPDLFIMDIGLPERETGFYVLETLNQRYPYVPKIIITCYSDASTAVRSFKLGAIDYIQKPFDSSDLKQRVKQALQSNSQTAAYTPQFSYA